MAVGLALGAVLHFLYAHPHLTAQRLHRPLYVLLAALDDLSKGRVAPMLEPAVFENRHPDAAIKREARGHALFCIDLLVASGMSIAAACREVTKVWNAHQTRGAGELAWRTVRDWYGRAAHARGDDPQILVLAALRKEMSTRTPSSRELALTLLDLVLSTLRLT
jgi:hypothetical protein